MKWRRLRERIASRLAGDEILAKLARGGAMALVIKVAAALLSFLMFLVLARASTIEEFGRFGFAFALSGMLSVVGSFGQRMMVMRYAPGYALEADTPRLVGVFRYGYALVAAGCLAASAAVAVAALFVPGIGDPDLMLGAAALTLAIGLAEFQAAALRTVAGMALALAPRDVFWRLGVTLIAGAWWLSAAPPLTALESLGIVAGVLFGVVVAQSLMHPLTRPRSLLAAPARIECHDWRRTALGLWGVSVIQIAGPNFAVVLVGVLAAPEVTAELFAALRIALLLDLVPLAAAMVASALLSRQWHAGDVEGVRRICRLVALGSAVPAFGAFLVFLVMGDWIMRRFGEAFAGADSLLLVLALGYLAKAVFGPANLLMQLAGRERAFMRIVAVCNAGSVVAILVLTPLLGAMGAAIGASGGMIAWTLWAQEDVRRRLDVDASLLAALRHLMRRRRGG